MSDSMVKHSNLKTMRNVLNSCASGSSIEQNNDPPRLNEEEIRIVRISWAEDETFRFDLALEIYENLFRIDPSLIRRFPSIADGELSTAAQLAKSQPFQHMALKLVQTLTLAVRNADNLSEISEDLHRIGKSHLKLAKLRTTAFRWQEFCSMRDAIICALTKRILENDALEENEKKRTIEAWKPVIEFVVFNVYYAYNEEST